MTLKTANISKKLYTERGYSMNLIVNDSTPHTIDDIKSIKEGIAIILENHPKEYLTDVRVQPGFSVEQGLRFEFASRLCPPLCDTLFFSAGLMAARKSDLSITSPTVRRVGGRGRSGKLRA